MSRFFFFFFNDTATTEIYTLSLHDALPISARLVEPAGHQAFILTDTVGFIRKLPHELVAAFRATLEELQDADLLLHVVDASHPAIDEHMRAVDELLGELQVADRPTLLAFNKMDRVEGDLGARHGGG